MSKIRRMFKMLRLRLRGKVKSNEMMSPRKMKKLNLPAFKGFTKEQYESYSPRQRYMLSLGNCCSLKDLDEKFGVKTNIGETEEEQREFMRKYREHQSQVADIVLNAMESEGCFARSE